MEETVVNNKELERETFIGWYLWLPHMTHIYTVMSWNVKPEVSGQSLYIMDKNKPSTSEASNWGGLKQWKKFLYATVHWSHCLAWKIRPCQMPVEWLDSKSVTTLWKQARLRGPGGWTAADPNTQGVALSPVCSHCHLFHLSTKCSQHRSDLFMCMCVRVCRVEVYLCSSSESPSG